MERISPQATRSCHKEVLVIDTELIQSKARDARNSKRNREIHILHTGDEDTLQRMLNAVQPGSYVAPHLHATPPKAESFLVLQGGIAFLTFSEKDGEVKDSWLIDPKLGRPGIDCREGIWHCFFALEPDTVVYEIKPGPYDNNTDKVFASFAPKENDPDALAYLAKLEDDFRKKHGLSPREWSL